MAIQKHEKEIMQVIKNSFKNTMLIILFLFPFVGCKNSMINLIPTYNEGGYIWEWFNSKSLNNKDSAWFNVSVYDKKNRDVLMPYTIYYGCNKFQTDNNKRYNFKVKPFDIKTQLKISSIGYLTVETKPIKINRGDSISIEFLLVEDDRPLINCEN